MELSNQLHAPVNVILSSHEGDYGVRGGKVPRILNLGNEWTLVLILVFLLCTVKKPLAVQRRLRGPVG
jgi:hypothetical protein